MATQRIKIDTRGKNIIQLFFDNINEISAINKLSAGPGDANTYDSNDGEVNITWPRAGIYDNAWQEPRQYQRYFVREINVPPRGIDDVDNPASPGNIPISETENDTHPNAKVENDRFAGKSPRALEYNDNVYSNDNAAGGGHKAGNFFRLKHRKSLYTLLQETAGVFFDGVRGPVYRNSSPAPGKNRNVFSRYSSGTMPGLPADESKGYGGGGTYVSGPPASWDIEKQAQDNANLGQMIGPDQSVINALIEKGKNISKEFFENLASDAIRNENPFLADWWNTLSGVVIGSDGGGGSQAVVRVSQLYRPGFSRPPIPGARGRHAQVPLSEALEQNLLLPPADGAYPINSKNDVSERVESTFRELYIDNRSAEGTVDPRYAKGRVGGTGVNDLQEPIRDLAGNADVRKGEVRVPFTFEKDDAVYLTHSNKVSGWIQNTPNATKNPDAMESAVWDIHKSTGITSEGNNLNREASYIANAREVIDVGNGQYFPFTFSTVNKKNMRMQICSLQATIQNLSESYAPTWQAKHFFGRSEQIHTYTFTDRSIDITFAIFAEEMRQLQNVYERVLWLAQQCYPDYNNKDRIATGPLIAMRVGDLFQHKAGFIRSLSYDWNYLGAGGKWELTRGVRMPQACSVSMSYQVIHERVPSRDFNFYGGPMGGVGAGMQIQRYSPYDNNKLGEEFDKEIRENDNGRYIPPGVANDKFNENGSDLGERNYLQFVDTQNKPEFDPLLINDLRAHAHDPETDDPSYDILN